MGLTTDKLLSSLEGVAEKMPKINYKQGRPACLSVCLSVCPVSIVTFHLRQTLEVVTAFQHKSETEDGRLGEKSLLCLPFSAIPVDNKTSQGYFGHTITITTCLQMLNSAV